MTKKEFLTSEATKLLQQGLNTIAVDGQKKAVASWAKFIKDFITTDEIGKQIYNSKAEGIAVICGAISGNLEVIDFDLKNDISVDLMERYNALIEPELLARLRIVKTRSGGFHYYYRCEVIGKNQKLANRPTNAAELKDTPTQKTLVIIETRAEGGYVVAPPSVGYTIEQDNEAPIITIDERESLLNAARSFNEIYTEQRIAFTPSQNTYLTSPLDDLNDKVYLPDLLTAKGWTINERTSNSKKVYLLRPGNSTAANSANYCTDRKLLYMWSSSTDFEAGQAYSAAKVYTILNFGAGEYSKATRQLIKDGFGIKATAENIERVEAIDTPIEGKFWKVKQNKMLEWIPEIEQVKFEKFIHDVGGFTGYKYSEASKSILVQEKDGFVKEVGLYEIKQFLKKMIMESDWLPATFDNITQEQLLEAVYKNHLTLLSDKFMEFLDETPFEFLKDTNEAAYFPFNNGIVEVTAGGSTFHKYGEFNKVIWSAQMIDKNIELIKDFGKDKDFSNIDYSKFLLKVCGGDIAKYQYFVSTIGYLLHKYKDPKTPYAIVLAEETENEAEGGGTGKGIFTTALKELIPTVVFDGKNFDMGKSFAFQNVTLDTKLISIDDAKRAFNFEAIYTLITEGFQVEKKNKDAFFIPFCDAPKIIISTNYAISDEGNHAKRRQKVLEFGNYFKPSHTPFDEFEKRLFEDWEKEEYNRFYNFMFWCVKVYLTGGILETAASETRKAKDFRLTYGEDLPLWFDGNKDGTIKEEPRNDLFVKFLADYKVDAKSYPQKKFNRGIKIIADELGYDIIDMFKKINGQTQRTITISKK